MALSGLSDLSRLSFTSVLFHRRARPATEFPTKNQSIKCHNEEENQEEEKEEEKKRKKKSKFSFIRP